MTDHEKDAAHARDELHQARLLLARWQGIHQADEACERIRQQHEVGGMKLVTDTERGVYHDTCKFMRRTSLYPSAVADA